MLTTATEGESNMANIRPLHQLTGTIGLYNLIEIREIEEADWLTGQTIDDLPRPPKHTPHLMEECYAD